MAAEQVVDGTLSKSTTIGEADTGGIEYGLPLQEVYKLAFNFYKGMLLCKNAHKLIQTILSRKRRQSFPL
ncbi:unnamed protein product [Acanthoscelides obtectus]|uniref:Uncharacterized protein n=1 Tax=Acanthoscelides obtectus TaxID=200917 RepID=A0A9P0MAI9_ACAOB|nr:unnamed protein product [Acanthoscelides obtectus]CAK1642426.1 hypothetical protein AOBTE_LOCUS13024 [Acanthoscelides obtectus]